MTRKTPSPMIESEIMIECDHMRIKKMSQEHLNEDTSMNYSVNGSSNNSKNNINRFHQFNNNLNNNNNNNNDSIVISPMKRLTSFEELAKKSESNSLLYIHEMDNNYSLTTTTTTTSTTRSKPKSDYNICYNYKNLDENEDYPSIKHQMVKSTSHSYNIRRSDRKYSSSDNSPFDYDLLKEKRKDQRFMYDEDGGRVIEGENSIKSYDRFFNSDDEIDDEYERRHSSRKKTSSNKYRSHVSGTEADDDENSSNSPPMNKSITPLNECIPLLSCDAETTIIYQSSAAPPTSIVPPSGSSSNSNSFKKTSKIPLRVGSNSMRKNSSISSPESDKSDNGYQTAINRFEKAQHAYQASSPSRSARNHKSSENKIRIKINQNN